MDARAPVSIGPDLIEAYRRDGVVCIRGAIDRGWIDRLWAAAQIVARDPAKYGQVSVSQSDTMTSVSFLWRKPGVFRDFIFQSNAAELTARIIGSRRIKIYHDHLFIKWPKSPRVMRWHADTIWPVDGEHVPNLYVALTPMNAENGRVEYIAGHHTYCLERGLKYGKADPCPDFEERRGDPELRFVSYDLAPGDAVLFHPLIPHYSKGNDSTDRPRAGLATRWFGDDIVWSAATDRSGVPGVTSMPPGEPPSGELFPVIWPAAA
ncbi:MAG: phytanoyl-CoA dioxygenase family protein [Rhodospirillaceae bacterium]|nr:phytanoyl-CoA dioxygenase family protein [Rhodospirillaceae bacterium]